MRSLAERSKPQLENMMSPGQKNENEGSFKIFWFTKDDPTGHT